MKIGIVKSINARPLTWGFETDLSSIIISDTPAALSLMLQRGEIDAALISSVECLRHADLDFNTSVGVCTENRVRSILYFRNKTETSIPSAVFVDNGSRSSVALLKILFRLGHNREIATSEEDPGRIQEMILAGQGHHLLFGDNAIFARWDEDVYETTDLSAWWNELTGLPFCYAFWAFSKNRPLPPELFENSLKAGLNAIDDIIARHPAFDREMLIKYFSEDLHYRTTARDLAGFELFAAYCREFKIL